MRGRHPWAVMAAAAFALSSVAACGDGGAPSSAPGLSAAVTTAGAAAVSTTAAAGPGATTDPCAVTGQAPARDTIDASFATALAFAPDGRLFWAERSGTVRVYQSGTAKEFATVPTVTTEAGGGYSERGLLGLAISPTFARDRFVYAFYSNANRTNQDIVRWKDCAGAGTDATVIVRLPAGSDCCHKGGRLAFGPDGDLYVTLGEQHAAAAAQDTSDVRGKVLRYRPDGSVPPDNPFGSGNPVWAYGFRNPFGLAFSDSGQLAVTENGPTGDAGSPSTGYDRVFAAVGKGQGFQWPNCYGYSHPLRGAGCGDGQREADWSSEGTTAVPTAATWVTGAGPAAYAGKLVFCTYVGGLRALTPGSPHATVSSGPSTCQLDVKQGPDNALYWSDQGRIYRMAA